MSTNLANILIMLYNFFIGRDNMKKEVKEKLSEIGSFIACLVVILAIAYFTGFLKGFAPKDFADAYNQLTSNLSNTSAGKKAGSNFIKKSSGAGAKNEVYAGYSVIRIPETVKRGVNTTHMWTFLFNSSKKTVFYIYDDSSADFDSSIKNYLSSKKNAGIYDIYSYTNSNFSGMNIGNYGPSEICNSLEECNAVRQRASDYSSMTAFLKHCGKTMCVINPSMQSYIRLKTRNANQAKQMLNDLRYW